VQPTAREEELLLEAFRSGWWTSGPFVGRLEEALRAQSGVGHAVAMSSCTAALEAALVVAGIGPGDEVVTPALTFSATSAAVLRAGGVPVWVDVDARSGNIGVDAVRAALTDRTRAILSVDMGGLPVAYGALREVSGEHGLAFVSDAAHSLGATDAGRAVEGLADAACLSFYATKNVAAGEGGALVTNNDTWAERAARWRLHGLSQGAEARYRSGAVHYDVTELGSKANLSDLHAAVALAQLESNAERLESRRRIARTYLRELAGVDGLGLPEDAPGHAWHLFVIHVPPAERDAVVGRLIAEGVRPSCHFRPVHEFTFWREQGLQRFPLPRSEEWGRTAVSLPLFSSMTDKDVSHVLERLVEAVSPAGVG
jgi:dTDP-4-amino-4,6-dideoxygalactose transaminase